MRRVPRNSLRERLKIPGGRMGLHLCYELSLPSGTSPATVAEYVARLHKRTVTLPFTGVSSIVDRRAVNPDQHDRPLGWTYRSLEDVVAFHAFGVRDSLYRRAVEMDPEDPRDIRAPRDTLMDVIAYAVAPGRGSEPASFGFARLANPGRPSDWYWHECCKTQYASVVSDEHLVRCHTSLVSVLDAANDLGIQVEVHDETGFWSSRDRYQLIESVTEMNRIIAQFAGKMTDALRETEGARDTLKTDGAIFDHPDFERLETEGQE